MPLEDMLVNRCDIQRWSGRQPESDFTVNKANYATVLEGVQFNLQIRSASRTVNVGGADVIFNAVGFFAFDVDLKPGAVDNANADRIVVTDPETSQRFYVRAVIDESGHGLFKKAFLESE